MKSAAAMRIGLDGRELKPGIRTGIRRYLVEGRSSSRSTTSTSSATALARLYARWAAAIVVRLGVTPSKVTVIPVALGEEFTAGARADALGMRYGIASPYILYVGNFKPHKNLPRLLRAYATLPAQFRSAYALVLAGGDREGRLALKAIAASLGIGGSAIFPRRIAGCARNCAASGDFDRQPGRSRARRPRSSAGSGNINARGVRVEECAGLA